MRKENEAERRGDVLKLCIINHVQHEVYIEVIAVSLLEDKYNGDEEAYIMDMYGFPKEYFKNGYVSWEWFHDITLYGELSDERTTTFSDINKI